MSHNTLAPELVLLSPAHLHPTEECVPERIREVAADILRQGCWNEPILVERDSAIVMDGHHRHAFALQHGFARIPCLLVSYADVALGTWRDDVTVSPGDIIARGLAGRLYPPKSTRHTLLKPVPHRCHFPLAMLCDIAAAPRDERPDAGTP